MAKHRCYVCGKMDAARKLVFAVFTKDQHRKRGHALCFADCNRDLMQRFEPYRWKIEGADDKKEAAPKLQTVEDENKMLRMAIKKLGCGGRHTYGIDGYDFDCDHAYPWDCDRCPCNDKELSDDLSE